MISALQSAVTCNRGAPLLSINLVQTPHDAFTKRKALSSARAQDAKRIQRTRVSSNEYASYELSNGAHETIRRFAHRAVSIFLPYRIKLFLNFERRFMAASAIADEEPETSEQGESASQTANGTIS